MVIVTWFLLILWRTLFLESEIAPSSWSDVWYLEITGRSIIFWVDDEESQSLRLSVSPERLEVCSSLEDQIYRDQTLERNVFYQNCELWVPWNLGPREDRSALRGLHWLQSLHQSDLSMGLKVGKQSPPNKQSFMNLFMKYSLLYISTAYNEQCVLEGMVPSECVNRQVGSNGKKIWWYFTNVL